MPSGRKVVCFFFVGLRLAPRAKASSSYNNFVFEFFFFALVGKLACAVGGEEKATGGCSGCLLGRNDRPKHREYDIKWTSYHRKKGWRDTSAKKKRQQAAVAAVSRSKRSTQASGRRHKTDFVPPKTGVEREVSSSVDLRWSNISAVPLNGFDEWQGLHRQCLHFSDI
mmetsp:Transcript_7254/g.17690  ORF Transcript_7254/g.17690 Transcript_7254/m.17690 type:complete len:168 (-) Transcript_7254:36-539(-)